MAKGGNKGGDKPAKPMGNWVEGTLGDFKAVPGKNRRIDLLVVVPPG